jgi:aminoglycoside phosphotransferase (APT) family kinase protein
VLFAKCFDPSRFAPVLAVERAWRQACDAARSPLTPLLKAFDVERGLLVHERAAGRCLHDLIHEGQVAPWADIARALRAVSDLPILDLRRHGPDDEIATIAKLAGFLRHEDAERAQLLEDRLSALKPMPAGGPFVLHRDLHDKQIFIAPSSVQFIDLETSALGDRELDVANLAEHAFLRGVQMGDAGAGRRQRAAWLALFEGLDRERLRFYRASTLLRLCVVYSMRAAPEDLIESLLTEHDDVSRNRP